MSAISLFPKTPIIHFYPEVEICPFCGAKLQVQKTQTKAVVTMDIGAFVAKETCFKCSCNKKVHGSQELHSLVPEHGTFGFDVIVFVGKALFIHCLGVQEIVDRLAKRNITISPNEVTYLGKKFIVYLAQAHREARNDLRDTLRRRGGYTLHVDGTCEGNSPNLFSGLDGISELVLSNIKIPSEKKELLVPFFEQIQKQYGDPIALVHDMGKGILTAVEKVFPDTPDFICHFHFLRDIGKDLFGKEYKVVFDRLKSHGIRTVLRRRLKALAKKMADDSQVLDDFKTDFDEGKIEISRLGQVPIISTYALIHWIFDAPSTSAGYGFPFDCPHLVFFQRLKKVHCVLKQIMDIRLRNNFKDNRPLYQLWHLLDKVVSDNKLAQAATSIEAKREVFNELRAALRIALPEGKDGLNDDGKIAEMTTIESAVKEFRNQVISDESLSSNDDYLKMIAQIDKYWEKLFADPITVQTPEGPAEITPQRTNNILERFFRDLKRQGRKRTGAASLTKMLKTILADTPLTANLKSEQYLKTILADCKTLEERFSQIDADKVRDQLKNEQQEPLRISTEIKPLIKQENLPDKIALLFNQANTTKSNGHLRS